MAQLQTKRLVYGTCSSTIASVEQDQTVKQEQSFAMVRVLLLSSVSTFTSLRSVTTEHTVEILMFIGHSGLFPDHCFVTRKYNDVREQSHRIYKMFHQKLTPRLRNLDEISSDSTGGDEPFDLRVLTRGQTGGSDRLLDWMDVILEEVLKKRLTSVRFTIYADMENPLDVIESYTLSFEYSENVRSEDSEIVAFSLAGPLGKPLTMKGAMSGVQKIIKQLKEIDINLPALPDQRFLMCYILRRPDISQFYYPRGFHPCENSNVVVAGDESWNLERMSLGAIHTGFHNVGFTVGHKPHVSGTKKNLQTALTSPNKTPQQITFSPEYISRPRSSVKAARKGSLHHDSLIMTQELPSSIMHQKPSINATRLLPRNIQELEKRRDDLIRNQPKTSQKKEDSVIRCECDHGLEEGDMLLCDCCGQWQHCHCYGFTLEKPQDHHFCYRCLLADSDQLRLEKLRGLARFRRALWMAYTNGYPRSKAHFAKILHYDPRETTKVVQRMQDEGYLHLATQNKLELVDSPEQIRIKDVEYFDPMTLIRSYYEYISADGSAASSFTTTPEPRQWRSSRKRTRSNSATDFIDYS